MQIYRLLMFSLLLLGLSTTSLPAQKQEKIAFLEKADTFHAPRFWTSFGIAGVTYTSAMIGLNQAWYADFPRSSFHFFDDWDEWEKMDKVGHSTATYQESRIVFELLRWSGIKQRKAAWLSVGVASFLQLSLETLDGYSEEWGFSLYDFAFNTAGAGLFLAQELTWQEQRIMMKISSSGVKYPNTSILSNNGQQMVNLQDRASELYGANPAERFLKDYNGQTIWLSANVHSFLPEASKFPNWLNVALGYGAQNMYGGSDNIWESGENTFTLDEVAFPRYQQFYLSFDVDLTKIKTKNRFLRTTLKVLNFIKVPSPSLEVNSLGKVKFHPLHF